MRSVVIGAGGLVGNSLCIALEGRGHTPVGISRRAVVPGIIELDVADDTATRRLLYDLQPDWIFYPAGWTWVDGCEADPQRATVQNVILPLKVARIAQEIDCGFTYFSTEYVFDGYDGPYDESSIPNPLSVYGKTKRRAEQLLLDLNLQVLVIRTTVVYGAEPQGKNFVYQVRAKAAAGDRIVVPQDQISTPTYAPDLAAASVECAERKLTGIMNIVGPDRVDRFTFAQQICTAFGLNPYLLVPCSTAEMNQAAPRPLAAGLVSTLIRRSVSVPLLGPVEGLHATKQSLG